MQNEKPPEPRLMTPANIALNKLAFQSSFSAYSHDDDPLRAINGQKDGTFSFHTEREQRPWWLLDMEGIFSITSIRIYNRCDAARSRIRNCEISYFSRDKTWITIYKAVNEFGGLSDQSPLFISFGGEHIDTRFIKIELADETILHLDEVEVFGLDKLAVYASGLLSFPAPPPSNPQQLGAIVVLTRGYEDVEMYADLIERNRLINECINVRFGKNYPLIIWHEGNIPQHHQSYILSSEKNSDVRFVDVSDRFRLPTHISDSSLQEHWPVGYRLMCKFNSFDIWDLSFDFKYIMRIDEDCNIRELAVDPFVWAEERNIDVGFSFMCKEDHELTNNSLPYFTEAYISANISEVKRNSFYKDFPYTNVMLSRVAFFRTAQVNDFLNNAIFQQDFYDNRWGDLPILGIAINLFSNESLIQSIPGCVYYHSSHRAMIECRDNRHNHDKLSSSLPTQDAQAVTWDGKNPLHAIKDRPLDSEVRRSLANHLKETGHHKLAQRIEASPSSRIDIEVRKIEAGRLLARGMYSEAIKVFASMFEEHAAHFEGEARDLVTSSRDEPALYWKAPDHVITDKDSITNVFSQIYRDNIWGGGSGGGSFIERSAMYAGFVQYILSKTNAKSVCDVGCGDWQFSQYLDFAGVSYHGFDVVSSVIAHNKQRFGKEGVEFHQADASILEIPPCDLIICKDVLQHLDNASVLKILGKHSLAKNWLITNDYSPLNAESRNGDTRPLDPTAAPFSISARPVLSFDRKVTFLVGSSCST